MQTLVKTMLMLGLAVCAAPCARATSSADLPKSGQSDVTKTPEFKGDLASAHGDFRTAIYQYKQALIADPRNPKLYNKLGIVEMKDDNNRAARKDFQRALKYDPRNVAAYNNLGAVACIQRKYKDAVKYLKKALALNELTASAHLNMAEAWMGLHEVDRAMVEYARAVELDADILSTDRAGTIAQLATPEQRALVAYLIARAYAKRGNLDGALEYLQRAKDGHFTGLAKVYTDQEFAGLWQDPRLAKIVKR